jgi:polyphosphate glucokinase
MKKEQRSESPESSESTAKIKLPRTLAIDIGGTGVKAVVLDAGGKIIRQRVRLPTPRKATPKKLLKVIAALAEQQGEFERVSAGFPGVVKDGVVYSAANLGHGWQNYDLAKTLAKRLKRPVRVANDADVQGVGSVSGHGLELVITLGTGFGSVLFMNGAPIHLELGHHPFHKGKTYEQELGNRAFLKSGRKRWNRHLLEAIDDLAITFNYDRLYIGGGNAKFISIALPPNVKIISNEDGMLGGIVLWREPRDASMRRGAHPKPVQTARGAAARDGGTAASNEISTSSPNSEKPA